MDERGPLTVMRERAEALDRALQSLTPGGSEFVHDPERCIAFVRDARASEMRALKAAVKRAREAERRAEALAAENARWKKEHDEVCDAWHREQAECRRLRGEIRAAIKTVDDVERRLFRASDLHDNMEHWLRMGEMQTYLREQVREPLSAALSPQAGERGEEEEKPKVWLLGSHKVGEDGCTCPGCEAEKKRRASKTAL